MSLFKCPDCGKEVSSKALFCPNCGYQLPECVLFAGEIAPMGYDVTITPSVFIFKGKAKALKIPHTYIIPTRTIKYILFFDTVHKFSIFDSNEKEEIVAEHSIGKRYDEFKQAVISALSQGRVVSVYGSNSQKENNNSEMAATNVFPSIKCPDCGKDIPIGAKECPNCGCPESMFANQGNN